MRQMAPYVEAINPPRCLTGREVPGLDEVIDLIMIFFLCDGIPSTVRSLKHVFVKVHDEVDCARRFHIEMTVSQEQQIMVVGYKPPILHSTTTILHIALVINECSFQERL